MGSIGPELLGRLFDAHAAALRLYACQWCEGSDAEDAVQDAFLSLARSRPYLTMWPPGSIAWSQSEAAEQRLKAVKAGLLTVLAELQPSIINCLDAQMRLDQRVAALRVVEAIRLYAASHDGKLPEELNQVTEVPVPDDPATGKPFEYRRDGAAAVLILPEAGLRGRPTPSYRITIRKRTDETKP